MCKLLSQRPKKQKTRSPLLHLTNIFVGIVSHYGLDCCFATLKQSIEPVNVVLVPHVEPVLAVGHNIHIEFVVDLLSFVNFFVVTEPIAEFICIFIDEAGDTLPLSCRCHPVDLEYFFRDTLFVNPDVFL